MLAKKFLKKETGPARRQAGFTLIELLVVIVIISILAIFLFVAFTQVQKNARDEQRKNDLQTVAGALQRFYSDNSHYPKGSLLGQISYKSASDCTYDIATPATWGTSGISCGTPSTTYIKQLPKDPTGTNEYCYTSADEQHYILYAQLEGNGNVDPATTTCNSLNGIYNYQVTPQD